MRIGRFAIGEDAPCLVIAEAGVNHNGSMDLAHRLIDAGADAGADAVKFQTFRADRVMTPNAPKAAYQKASTDPGESQLDMVRQLELSQEQFVELQRHCAERDVLFLSTPFDHDSADFLVDVLDVPAVKIPSGEVTNLPMLDHIGRKGRPVILSTGMADLAEVDIAVRTLQGTGCADIALLHCVSNYPAAPATVNLRAMATMSRAFRLPVGYSDHTLGLDVALAAIALGARILEKHFTLDKGLPGPDHTASLAPEELKSLVKGVRTVESALGDGRKRPDPAEADTAAVARRSLFARHDLAEGTVLDRTDLIALRPAGGISPAHIALVEGRILRRPLAAGAMLAWGDC